MDPLCHTFRDEALRAALPAATRVVDGEHASVCAACAAWQARLARQVESLAGLTRLAAPFELDGRVVGAVEAGGRQARAAQALEDLGRVRSPRELDRAVDAELEEAEQAYDFPSPLRAPAVLDRLVSEELADPAKARMRRFLGSLTRQSAPESLRLRVAAELESLGRPRPARPRTRLLAGFALAAAALLVWMGVRDAGQPESVRRYDFEIVDGGSVEALPGLAAGLMDGMLGGSLGARRQL